MNANHRQSGTALVTSLLLLLVLTVVGITAMQMTRMQERMAGNTRDMNLAFQGAEAGLRNGEDMLNAQAFAPTPPAGTCSTTPCKVWDANAAAVANPETRNDAWWTGGTAMSYQANLNWATPTNEVAGLAHDPNFVVEYIGEDPDPISLGEGSGPPTARFFYQVTAASPGATTSAITVLQSTFARR